MKRRYGVFVFFAFFLLGILGTAQFRTVMNAKKHDSTNKYQIEQLQVMIKQEKEQVTKLKSAIVENEKKRDENLKQAANLTESKIAASQLQKLNEAKLKAGLTEVKGMGITLKLDDAPARANLPSWMIGSLVIHDADIKILVNELKMAGAQAISINSERLMSTSEQVCAGPTIMINKNRYPVPYVIKAIGNMDMLYKAIDESERIKLMRRDGIRIVIEKSKDIKTEKYSNDLVRITEGMEVIEK